MISQELARSIHEERIHEIQAETSWRRQLEAARGARLRRQGFLRRLAGLVATAVPTARGVSRDRPTA